MANSDKMIVFEEIFSKIFEYWFQKFHMVYNLDIYLIQGTPSGQSTYVLLINRVLRDVGLQSTRSVCPALIVQIILKCSNG